MYTNSKSLLMNALTKYINIIMEKYSEDIETPSKNVSVTKMMSRQGYMTAPDTIRIGKVGK